MPDIYAWKKSGWFLVLDFFDGGIPSACDNFVAPQIHRDFHHPFFRNPISSPYFGDIVSDAWKSKWHITHQNHKNIKEHQGNTCVFCHVFLPFPAISCHFLVIVCLFFNNVFNFLAWKQQNQWTIEENQWKSKANQRNYTRKPMKTWRKPTRNKKQPKREEIHGKVAKHKKTCRKQMNKNKRIREKQLNTTHQTLESWKHRKENQSNMTKTW